jgi:hypothetical protein
MLTASEFAARIRSKYPGAYDDLPDDELTSRILAKFPEYGDMVSAPANPPQKISTKMIDAIPGGAAEVKRRAAAGEPVVQEGLRRGGVLDEIRAGVAGAAAGAVEGIAGPVGLAIDAARYAQNGLPGAVAQMGADLAQGRFLPATQAVSSGADAVQNAIGPGEDIATSAAPAFIRTGVDLAMPGPEVALAGRGVRKVMGEGAEAAAKLADDVAPLADDAARMAEDAAADAGTVPPELAGVHSGAEINLPETAPPVQIAPAPIPVKEIPKPREFRFTEDPGEINGKTFYHGTGTEGLDVSQLDPSVTKAEGLFGQGIYLTDDPDIAAGYAKARGKQTGKEVVYQAKVNIDRVLNLEKPAPTDVLDEITAQARSIAGDETSFLDDYMRVASKPGVTAEEAWRALSTMTSDLSHELQIPAYEYYENFGYLAERIKQLGYDALTHTGGKRTGKAPHQVLIVLDPHDYAGTGRGGQITEFAPHDMYPPRRIEAQLPPPPPPPPPPTEPPVAPPAPQPSPVDPVQKVVQALREAKPIRREQEAIYRAERGARMDTALEARAAGMTGEAGFNAEKAALGGPMEKLQFESLRSQISQQDVDALFDRVAQSDLTFWESITARRGLAKLFGEYGGHVPQKSEMALLRRVFGDELPNEMLKKRSLWAKFKDVTVEVANVPRAIMASFDLSAPFRQGAFFVGRPKRFFPAFKELLRAYGSEDAYQAVHDAIRARPSFPLMEESGLAITDLERAAGTAGREENFVSNLAERIPLVGRGVRASGRAHTAFLVKMRADVFDDIVKRASDLGLKPEDDPALLGHIAKYVNAGTGRGELPQVLQGSADLLNTLMFSPRLMFSRLHLLNPQTYLDPKIPALVRREAMKDALKFAAVGSSVLSMAALNGLEVGLDPRSADFGKIKMQDTRIDVWGGFQQYVRMAAQLASGQYVSTTKPDVVKELGVGYKPQTRLGILGRQAESKLAPVASFVVDMLRGQDYRGQPIDVQQEIVTRIVPIIAQDIKALYDEDPSLIPLAALSALGFGVQTYAKPKPKEEPKKKPVADASSALEGLRQETAPLSREAGAQVAAAKAGVYVDPDGRETPIPRALMLSALRREDPTEASSPMMRWLAGMQKQKKIKAGGTVEFRVA